MRKQSIKVGLGVLFLLAIFNLKSVSFESAEAVGFSMYTLVAIPLGVGLIYSGYKGMKEYNRTNKSE